MVFVVFEHKYGIGQVWLPFFKGFDVEDVVVHKADVNMDGISKLFAAFNIFGGKNRDSLQFGFVFKIRHFLPPNGSSNFVEDIFFFE